MSNPEEWKKIIHDRLKTAFPEATTIQVVINDASSGKYAVLIVADAFANKSPVMRHRAVNKAIGMNASSDDPEDKKTCEAIHALNIDARTIKENEEEQK